MATKIKKKEPITLTLEDKFYKQFNGMAKVNFLGFVMKDYFTERLIGRDPESIEAAKIKSILRLLEEKFTDQV